MTSFLCFQFISILFSRLFVNLSVEVHVNSNCNRVRLNLLPCQEMHALYCFLCQKQVLCFRAKWYLQFCLLQLQVAGQPEIPIKIDEVLTWNTFLNITQLSSNIYATGLQGQPDTICISVMYGRDCFSPLVSFTFVDYYCYYLRNSSLIPVLQLYVTKIGGAASLHHT